MYLENLFIYLKKLKKHYILFTISWSRTFQKNCLRTVFFFFLRLCFTVLLNKMTPFFLQQVFDLLVKNQEPHAKNKRKRKEEKGGACFQDVQCK